MLMQDSNASILCGETLEQPSALSTEETKLRYLCFFHWMIVTFVISLPFR